MILAIIILSWAYLLFILKRKKFNAFFLIVGSAGLFMLLGIYLSPLLLIPVSQLLLMVVDRVLSIFTDSFNILKEYLLINIGATSLYLTPECSGLIESFIFISILTFFPLYTRLQKCMVGILGIIWIFFANVIRLVFISIVIYWGGQEFVFLAHSILGRIIFFLLVTVLYFQVFTRRQVIKISLS